MKHLNISFLLTLLMSMVGIRTFAYDAYINGIYYNFNGSEAEVTYKIQYEKSYQGDVVIPESVRYNGKYYSVTSIGCYTFQSCYRLTSVTIPNSVKIISSFAFDYCVNLKSVTIPNSVTTIESSAFKDCRYLPSITIPQSVTKIGYGAFAGCSGLLSIDVASGNKVYDSRDNCNAIIETATNTIIAGCKTTEIPNSVTSIGECAFQGCSNLRSITIPNSVTSIGNRAFYQCAGMENITLGTSLSDFGDDPFQYCNGLKNVTFHCREIRGWFSYIKSITNIFIGDEVNKISSGAFIGCSGITSMDVSSGNTVYDSRDNCNAIIETATNTLIAGCYTTVIPNTIKRIGSGAFNGSGLKWVSIPSSVTSIGAGAFYNTPWYNSQPDGLVYADHFVYDYKGEMPHDTEIEINDATGIADRAFYNCENLKSVKIGNSVTNIGEMAFYNCSGITSLTIGKSVTDVGSSAFKHCSGLKSVTYYCKEIRRWFPGSSITNVVIGDGVEVIGNNAFDDCSCLSSIIIPNSVTTICDLAFWGCSGLTNLSIGSSVKNVGSNVFLGCTALKSIEFHCREIGGWFNPSSPFLVTTLENVTNVVISDEVKAIGDYAFVGFSGLKEIKIPESVTSIGVGAFAYCSGLLSIDVAPGNKAYDSRNNCNAIIETATNMIVAGCKNTVIPESVTGIGCYAFCGCSGLSIVKIPNSVTSIGDFAFRDCIGLKTITIPNSVTTIGYNAFSDCNITSLELHCKKIGDVRNLFGEEPTLKEIIIGDEVEEISSSALSDCSNLISIKVASGNKIFDSRENCNAIIETATNKMVAGCQNTFIPNSVTSIGGYAFYGCSGLVSITIPNSITSIGSQAFANCSNLNNITFPNSFINISDNAFDKTAWYDDQPEGLVYAGKIAYKYKGEVQEITSIVIKEGTLALSNDLFNGGSGLKSVTIPNSVTAIGSYVFSGCSSLTSITIPNNVTSIGLYAFSGCTSLTSITIPNSVTSIGYSTFKDCIGLTNITLGSSLTSIESWAFGGCNSIENVTFHCKEIKNYWFPNQVKTNIKNVVIGDGVNTIDNNAFSGYSSLTSVTMSNSVTAIGSSAFENCTCLKSITIPSSVNSIEGNVFSGCRDLSSIVVTSGNKVFDSRNNCNAIIKTATNTLVVGCKNTVIPNSVTTIGNYAFYNCSGLATITIPNSVTKIKYGAFRDCSSLTSIIIGNSVTIIDDMYYSPVSVFYGCSLTSIIVDPGNNKYDSRDNCNAIIETSTNKLLLGSCNTVIPNSVTSIGECAFDGCSGLTSITIPNSVTSIGIYAFNNSGIFQKAPDGVFYVDNWVCGYKGNMPNNTTLTLLDTTRGIGDSAFSDCSGLTSITIPNSVTSISYSAFSGCSGLTSITIPNSVTSIGSYAFDGCSGLTSITIPNSVTSIGSFAFRDCSGLTSITIPNSVTSIGDFAFYECSGLTSITIPNSVTSIGDDAFSGCSGLTSITIPNSVTSIGSYAFSGCSGLTSITIPNSVTSIGNGAFFHTGWYESQPDGILYLDKWLIDCKGPNPSGDITIAGGTKGIARYAFNGCTGLTSVIIPNSVTSIGSWAFEGCLYLNKVTCRATTPPNLGSHVFWNNILSNSELFNCELYVPKGCVDAYKAADQWKDFGMIREEDESTPVQPIINRCDNGTYYNLNGQRVTKPTKGLYIVDGKKVVKR